MKMAIHNVLDVLSMYSRPQGSLNVMVLICLSGAFQ